MGLSTHILDTAIGRPAANVSLALSKFDDGTWREIGRDQTDADGRCKTLLGDTPLEAASTSTAGNPSRHTLAAASFIRSRAEIPTRARILHQAMPITAAIARSCSARCSIAGSALGHSASTSHPLAPSRHSAKNPAHCAREIAAGSATTSTRARLRPPERAT